MEGLSQEQFTQFMRRAIEELAQEDLTLSAEDRTENFIVNTLKLGFTLADRDLPVGMGTTGVELAYRIYQSLIEKATEAKKNGWLPEEDPELTMKDFIWKGPLPKTTVQ